MKSNFNCAGIDIVFWVDGVRYKAIASKTREYFSSMGLHEDIRRHAPTRDIIVKYAKDERIRELFEDTIEAFAGYLGKKEAISSLDSILKDLKKKVDSGVEY